MPQEPCHLRPQERVCVAATVALDPAALTPGRESASQRQKLSLQPLPALHLADECRTLLAVYRPPVDLAGLRLGEIHDEGQYPYQDEPDAHQIV
jgi:hypothetical protein